MIRVTSDAELVWERYIQDNRLADDVYIELRDVAECSDGSIAAAGLWIAQGTPRDGGNTLRSWVVKLDADGCLEPGCTSDTIHLMRPVANEEIVRGGNLHHKNQPQPSRRKPPPRNLWLKYTGQSAKVHDCQQRRPYLTIRAGDR
jgi:hypothetical protein